MKNLRWRMLGLGVLLAMMIALVPALAPGLAPMVRAADWPMERGDLGNTGFNPGETERVTLTQKWSRNLDPYAVASSLTVAGGRVFYGSFAGYVKCLDAATGAELWSKMVDDASVNSTPVVVGSSLYVGTNSGFIYKLSTSDGAQEWRAGDGGGKAFLSGGKPLSDRILYVRGTPSAQEVVAYDLATGALMWSVPASTWDTDAHLIETPPAVGFVSGSPRVAVLDSAGDLVCLDAADGSMKWKVAMPAYNAFSSVPPVILDGRVFVCNSYSDAITDNVACYDLASGAKQWSALKPDVTQLRHMSAANGSVYFGTAVYDGDWYTTYLVLDAATGSLKRSINVAAPGSSVLGGEFIYSYDSVDLNALITFDETSPFPLETRPTSAVDATMALAEGMLFVTTDGGYSIAAYGGGATPPPAAESDWTGTLTATPEPVQAGRELTYTLSYRNTGDVPITGASYSLALPAEVTYLRSDPAGSYDEATKTMTWDLGTVPAATSGQLTAVVQAPDLAPGATLNVQAQAVFVCNELGDALPPLTAESSVVNGLLVTMTADKQYAGPCEAVTYTIEVTNQLDVPFGEAALVATIPTGARLMLADGNAALTDQTSWTIKEIAAHSTNKLTFQIRVDRDIPATTTELVNTATLELKASGATIETLPVTVYVNRPYLSIIKTANRREAFTDDVITYTVIVSNISETDNAYNVVVRDALPAGFDYLTDSAVLDDYWAPVMRVQEGEHIWEIGDLPPGTSAVLTYQVKVTLKARLGSNVNRAWADAEAEYGAMLTVGPAQAAVRVREGVFTQFGTVIGKVFVDTNGDGWQDKGELGLAGVTLTMEDATQVTTDDFGRYTVPSVAPGQHAIGIDPRALGGEYIVPRETQWLLLTRGGLAKINFPLKPLGTTEETP